MGSDLFQQEVQVRNKAKAPMHSTDRLRMRFQAWKMRIFRRRNHAEMKLMGAMSNAPSESSLGVSGNDPAHPEVNAAGHPPAASFGKASRRQFTVTKVKKPVTLSEKLWHRINNPDDFSFTPNTYIVKYVNWSYTSGFLVVFVSFLAVFLFIVFVFGLFLKWAGEAQPHCIIVAGEKFGTNDGTTLADAFALSWTTFTTVGYGAVYTATGNDENFSQHSCALITILCTAESFIGLLYAGVCTAIMFGKIGRIQSHAQVTFSDAMCVEYGKEEESSSTPLPQSTSARAGDAAMSSGNRPTGTVFSIPKVASGQRKSQFRNHVGIPLDANEAVINEADEENDGADKAEDGVSHDTGDVTGNEGGSTKQDHVDGSSKNGEDSSVNVSDDESGDSSSYSSSSASRTFTGKRILCPVLRFQLVNQLANDPGGEILDAHLNFMVRKEKESYPYEPIARFLKVELEEATHPFFNRVWHGRHVLNEDSPLVSVVARQRIRQNDGYWPSDLNDPDSIRFHLRFSSVIITMTGISSISAESVQISKRYYHHDVVIGYQFAPLLYKTADTDKLRVDMTLINDVVEQQWNVGEALSEKEVSRPSLRASIHNW